MTGPLLVASSLVAVALAAWTVQPPAPRHPPSLIAFWEHIQARPIVSVLLVSRPAPAPTR